ncbi:MULTISPECIES: DUF397 domain-containing protein [Streptomyces]|jgi:hypothetical protein|uniref:DUF397 domain-containing protein n=1 Tax=Streptomyces thermoviolaceus subsp. thermoviolaceus TaxID=66860 RepID=A0ABX0YYM2_STRTL|nr:MULTISPECIES: DUF397 domain-containing protein [Streptomyces]MCM3265503.1 DUF397 domain-containing protein [Streptomyces thermoviolaceus]NJP16163.1 DUF397 domain-containing protein [Streptomyces thermoviolaceus subsp. thermoviolaceus]RSS02287.1 DUF397 domain-containing protein [Streptomyces sp. WAC00469]WTD49027.1 DUF397 domain-containing protein [Streptomyces thermoviolaceus]GGV73975.1 DUF397 domain-containing protein [Streptomyces thermoviolaceus subsp. apingens]
MQDLGRQTSTHSGDGTNGVEVATTPTTVHVRDSKTPTAPRLTAAPATWAEFLPYVARAGA